MFAVAAYFSETTMKDPTLSVRRAALVMICVSSVLTTVLVLPACTDYWKSLKQARELFRPEWSSAEWREEVQLSDGRVVEITQQRQYEKVYVGDGSGKSTIVRDAWIRFRLPETDFKEAVWHEQLIGMRFDVVDGKPFIVAYPHVGAQFIKYGKPKPAYLAFIYDNNKWQRVPFSDIPEDQYDFNLVAKQILPNGMTHLNLVEKKNKLFNGNPDIDSCYKRINLKQVCSYSQ
jgi:hypothetical protein